MSNIFLIADTHFGHKGVTQFRNVDGSKLRPWDDVEEMDEALVANWNSVVRPKDKVYLLGDVLINRKAFPTLKRLNGENILVRGNHDIFPLNEYTPYFKDVRGTHKLDNMILSHIPIHPDSIASWCSGNIHGHLHSGKVMKNFGVSIGNWLKGKKDLYDIDPRYLCVSVEQINYTPIPFETVKQIMKEQQ